MAEERATLVLPGTPHVVSARHVGDTRTALCRGLAEYLLDNIQAEAEGGRKLRLKHVFSTWAEPEDEATYPSAIVYAPGSATYDASRFSPGVEARQRVPAPDNRYTVVLAEMVLDLTVELWTTDPSERAELVAAIEQGLNPLDNMYGLTLELPWYYNLRATYALQSMQYLDSEEESMRRYRRAVFTVTGQMPVVRLATIPGAKPRLDLQVVDGSVSPMIEVE